MKVEEKNPMLNNICVCVCVCVCERERETERQRDRERESKRDRENVSYTLAGKNGTELLVSAGQELQRSDILDSFTLKSFPCPEGLAFLGGGWGGRGIVDRIMALYLKDFSHHSKLK